jgi:hypothetical protein
MPILGAGEILIGRKTAGLDNAAADFLAQSLGLIGEGAYMDLSPVAPKGVSYPGTRGMP